MKRNRWIVALALAVVVVAAGFLGWRQAERARAREAIARYDLALATAVASHDPEVLRPVATEREITRVTAYVSGLWGRGVTLEAEMLELRLLDVTSRGSTVTAVARERWRYAERDVKTRLVVADPVEQVQTLEYTLVPRNGELVVELSRFVGDAEAGSR